MNMEVRNRRGRDSSSPDRFKVCIQPKVMKPKPKPKPIRKVQVVYYLTRNGQLEHPHYMEVTHLVNQPLRLRDVIERLTALRGKGMPSLYSWSCKRSYKNGYVWNDLAENDIIPPSDGLEYVLKGSELVERLEQFHISNRGPNPKQKSPSFALTQNRVAQETEEPEMEEEQEEEDEELYEVDEEKTSYTSSTTPHSRCSRGVSTDELDDPKPIPISEPDPDPPQNRAQTKTIPIPKRFEDGDPVPAESAPSRNSVLLQLIACGNLAVNKAKNTPAVKQAVPNNMVSKGENLHRGVLCKSAVKVAVAEDDQMIRCMSENPRFFGNLQGEEKEYFSGSIVESMSSDNRVEADQPVLKKSNSYNEERSCKTCLDEVAVEEEKKDKVAKGKCIPRKKSAAGAAKQTRK